MNKVLNVTNGDCAVDALKAAGVAGDFLPWRDVLHVGPLLSGELLGRFESSRVLFLSRYFDLPQAEVEAKFKSRHEFLNDIDQYRTVRLWFEHDLYDQLQLIQVLSFLAASVNRTKVRWVVTDHYLGPASPHEVQELFRFDESVPDSCWSLAVELWPLLTDVDPRLWAHQDDMKKFEQWPFALKALQRFRSEFPDKDSGLSLTQQHILSELSQGQQEGLTLFAACGEREWAKFMADQVFANELCELAHVKNPLVQRGIEEKHWSKESWSITPLGVDVLAGRKNHVQLNGINRWLAGTHLNNDNCWWFNKNTNQLEQ